MNYKKIIFVTVGVVIIGFVFFFIYKRITPTPIIQVTQNQNLSQKDGQISIVEQAALRQELQKIVAGGKEDDCVTLHDEQYQLACRSVFEKIGNKKL